MQLDAFLGRRGVALSDIAQAAQDRLGLAGDDVLLVCGSLVEGLGNETSDVDLYLLTSRTGFAFTSLDALLLAVGPCLIDVRVVPHAQFDALLARFRAWADQPRQARDALGFSHDERTLLHRLHCCAPLFGAIHLDSLRGRAPQADVARHKLDWARCYADALQIDLAGLRMEGDRDTLAFTAQDLLSHAIDGLLAAFGRTNPNGKWRVRLLAELPDGGFARLPGRPLGRSLRDEYVALHRAPDLEDVGAVHAHALGAVAFARRALAFAERTLVRPDAAPLPILGGRDGEGPHQPVLPHLDLDVTLRGDSLELLRLQGNGEVMSLSPESAVLLCLFDGHTSVSSAVASADHLFGEGKGAEVVGDLLALVEALKLAARPMLDVAVLARLLGRP
jgi:hypothetical protein